MRQNWGKLINRLSLSIASGVVISTGMISVFINTSYGDSKSPNQVSQRIKGNNNTINSEANSSSNSNASVVNSGNSYVNFGNGRQINNPNGYIEKFEGRQINNSNGYIENDNKKQQNNDCSRATITKGGICTNNGDVRVDAN